MSTVSFTLNGDRVEVHGDPTRTLLEVLRHGLNLRGTKSGCEIGYCGACTVMIDGRAVPACIQMVGLVEGMDIKTIEGVGSNNELDPVQRAFVECAGLQCGFCTPGHVMAVKAMIQNGPNPSDDEILATVDGNFCRCTGYVKIVDAAKQAVVWSREQELEGSGHSER